MPILTCKLNYGHSPIKEFEIGATSLKNSLIWSERVKCFLHNGPDARFDFFICDRINWEVNQPVDVFALGKAVILLFKNEYL